MNRQRAVALALRQQVLLLRSTELRGRLVADAAVLQPPLALADRVQEGWRWLRANPAAPVAALVVVAVLRPRRVWRWGWKLWWGWRTLRRLQRRLHGTR
jgi:hypothetical protein